MPSTEYFNEGLALYKNNEFDKAKFKFEQDIVFNPKSEKSYFIYQKYLINKKKEDLEEKNLNTVILLNPMNEEAVFNLAKLKLDESDFSESKKLVKNLKFLQRLLQKNQRSAVRNRKISKK